MPEPGAEDRGNRHRHAVSGVLPGNAHPSRGTGCTMPGAGTGMTPARRMLQGGEPVQWDGIGGKGRTLELFPLRNRKRYRSPVPAIAPPCRTSSLYCGRPRCPGDTGRKSVRLTLVRRDVPRRSGLKDRENGSRTRGQTKKRDWGRCQHDAPRRARRPAGFAPSARSRATRTRMR